MSLLLPMGNDKLPERSIHGLTRKRIHTITSISTSSEMGTLSTVDPAAVHVELATVATTGNVTLSGVQTIDGVAGTDGQTVLVRAQSTAAENGLYTMKSGAWSRLDGAVELTRMVRVLSGSTYGGAWMKLDGAVNPDIDTDTVIYSRLLTGSGTTNRLARWNAGVLAEGITVDDGTRVRVNTVTTSGRVNIGESSAFGAGLFVTNTATGTGSGAGVYGTASMDSGIGVQGNATGSTGVGVDGSGYIGVRGASTNGSAGVTAISTGTAKALLVERNVSAAGSAVASIAQKHASDSGVALLLTQVGSGHGLHVTGGTGRAGYITRNESSATTTVFEILQDHAGNNQGALKVVNDGTGSAAGAGWFESVGGIAVFAESEGRESLYAFRETSGLSTPTAFVWQKHTGDANPALRVRGDGTGSILDLQDNTSTVFQVKDGGVIDASGCGVIRARRTVSANATIAKDNYLILCDSASAGGNFTVTLPAPAAGMEFVLMQISPTTNRTVTIARNGSEKINGVSGNVTLGASYWKYQIWSDGTDWFLK